MKNTSRFILMSAVILMTLVMSAVWTVPAFADDGVPPPTEPVTEVGTPTEPSVDSAPVEETAPVESSPVEEIAPVESSPAEGSAPAEEATLPALLDQLPEGTEVVVTNEAGETVPLATEEAAQTITSGDPIWCPVGVAPKSNTGGCSPSFEFFTIDNVAPTGWNGLIDWLNTAGASKAGVIWVAWNYDNPSTPLVTSETGPIYINTSAAGTMEAFDLTIQGGWSGTPSSMLLNTTTPYSTFTVPLSITGWTGAITIKNITFNDVNVTSTPTTGDYALVVNTTGNITLDGVTVVDSDNTATLNMGGASLNNTNGGTGTGTVTVNNSAFNNNDGDGFVVQSDGIVTTNNLVANGNDGIGVSIDNTGNADKAVTMKGFKQFNGNGKEGLVIVSRGLVTLSNVTANNNGTLGTGVSTGTGVSIDNTQSVTNLGVTISGTNYFMGNTGDGLHVLSHGTITVSSINALYNGSGADGYGAYLDNSTGSVPKNVLLNGTSNFSWNANTGLYVLSMGAITANNITANNNNAGSGAFLDNSQSVTGLAGVSVLGSNYFLYNGNGDDSGITVWSHGAIFTKDITASFNDGIGAYLDNCNDNTSPADGFLNDCDSVTLAVPVSLTGTNTFNGNYFGLKIYSFGSITMSNMTVNSNISGQGANIQNNTNNISNVESKGTIALFGYGIFNFNNADGLFASSHSNIILTNVTANSNNYDGIRLTTDKTTGAASVNLKGTNTFNNNQQTGLTVIADGAIAVNNLTANSNGLSGTGQGASLENYISTLPAAVTLSGYVHVDNNPEQGLVINSSGAVTLYNVSANNNGNCSACPDTDGVSITNIIKNTTGDNLLTPQNVTLYGTNTFIGNGLSGLKVVTYGLITLNNVTANYNLEAGLYLDNHNAIKTSTLLPKGVIVTGYVHVSQNTYWGLYIDTRGAVSVANIYADSNGGVGFDGVWIKNNYDNHTDVAAATGAYSQNVTISGANTFTNNALNGLYVLSYGAIITTSTSSINASQNGEDGVYLNNCKAINLPECAYASTSKNLTLLGRNLFYMNGHDGLFFSISGAVSLSNVGADFNGGAVGGYIGKGIWGASNGAMTLACIHLYGNEGSGYNLTGSAVAIKGLNSWNGNPAYVADVSSPDPVITTNLLCP